MLLILFGTIALAGPGQIRFGGRAEQRDGTARQ
jgi:hypothetical protein